MSDSNQYVAGSPSLYFNDDNIPKPSSTQHTQERPRSTSPSMFNSLKKRLSRRGSNPRHQSGTDGNSKLTSITSQSGHLAPQSNNPFTSGTPPMRRPNAPEAPPSYTAATSPGISQVASPTSDDDKYDFLRSFDTIFVIDDSGSMAGRRWDETQEALETITPICTQYDADGIDIYFFNHPDSSYYKGVKTPGTIIEIFQNVRPGGGTPTGQKLNQIIKPYLDDFQKKAEKDKPKPINIIVITDGEPSDDVESVIINAARRLDKLEAPAWQIGIQFFQVGKEPGAREHLKQLDDGLKELAGEPIRDIVDTVPFKDDNNSKLSANGIMKVVLGSVNRRLDRSSKELHRTT